MAGCGCGRKKSKTIRHSRDAQKRAKRRIRLQKEKNKE